MSISRWFEACGEVLDRIRDTQSEANEPIHRAGGLLMMTPLRFSLSVETRAAPRRRELVARRQEEFRQSTEEGAVSLALERSALAPGDVLIVNSVSGKTATVVQVALSW